MLGCLPVSDVVTAEFLREDLQGTGTGVKAWLGQLSTPGQVCFLYKPKKKKKVSSKQESPQYLKLVEPLTLPISMWKFCSNLSFVGNFPQGLLFNHLLPSTRGRYSATVDGSRKGSFWCDLCFGRVCKYNLYFFYFSHVFQITLKPQ